MHCHRGINYGKAEENEEFMVCFVWVRNDAINARLFASRTVFPSGVSLIGAPAEQQKIGHTLGKVHYLICYGERMGKHNISANIK